MTTRVLVYKGKSNEGLPSKYKIIMCETCDDEQNFLIIRKSQFVSDPDWKHNKRKCGKLFYATEELVIRINTFLSLSTKIFELITEDKE